MCPSYRRIRNVQHSSFPSASSCFVNFPKVGKHSSVSATARKKVLEAGGGEAHFFDGAEVFAGFGGADTIGERVEFGQQGAMYGAVLFVSRH